MELQVQSIRLFVTNIPDNASEDELRCMFSTYGDVKKIDLKWKENFSVTKRTKFAFVTLSIDGECISQCIEDLNKCNFKGGRICVSKARESFLDRLMVEREEAIKAKNSSNDELCLWSQQKCNVFSSPDSLPGSNEWNQDEDCPQTFYSDLTTTWPNASQHLKKVELSDKAQISNFKRKEGLRKMQSVYVKNKAQIKNALSQIDKQHSKHAVKNDCADDKETTPGHYLVNVQPKVNLFDEDDENDVTNVSTKLDNVQYKWNFESKSNADPRFVMGSLFSENKCVENYEENGQNEISYENKLSELQWQIGIIERVIGRKVEQRKGQLGKVANILHYDPSKKEHEQFISTANPENSSKIKKVQLRKQVKDHQTENIDAVVSKELYYKVSENFTQSFHENRNEFSLLASFGVAQMNVEVDSCIGRLEETKIALNTGKNRPNFVHHLLPEDKDEDKVAEKLEMPRTSKIVVTSESLFIFKEDPRLSQGLTFFKLNKKKTEASKDYENIRKKLRFVINRKIARAKKKQVQYNIRKYSKIRGKINK